MAGNLSGETPKDISLEAMRGLAAIVVVVWHCCLGFWPELTGVFPEYGADSLQGYPFYFLINGHAAVSLFFVLSGYVLTRRYFLSGDNAILIRGAIKRWPRLMGPVLATVLVSYALFKTGAYAFEEAGAVSGSPWLVKFAWAYPGEPPPVSLWSALTQGSFLTFFRGNGLDFSYDSSLWTMHPEFMGSFIAFGMSPILFEAKKLSRWIALGLAICVALLANYTAPDLAAFPAGVAIAALLPRNKTLPKWAALILLPLALYLLGYSGKGVGAYTPFAVLPSQEKHFMYPAILGAAILICLFEAFPPLHRQFSGTVSRWLGEFSFPIYLIHILIVCSLGSTVYLHYGRTPAILSVLIVVPIAAFPLLVFNRKWVSAVNRITGIIVKGHGETSTTPAQTSVDTRPLQTVLTDMLAAEPKEAPRTDTPDAANR